MARQRDILRRLPSMRGESRSYEIASSMGDDKAHQSRNIVMSLNGYCHAENSMRPSSSHRADIVALEPRISLENLRISARKNPVLSEIAQQKDRKTCKRTWALALVPVFVQYQMTATRVESSVQSALQQSCAVVSEPWSEASRVICTTLAIAID